MEPTRFRFTIGTENIWFKYRIQMDISYLDVHLILQIFNEGKKFCADRFLANKSSK